MDFKRKQVEWDGKCGFNFPYAYARGSIQVKPANPARV
jgi:hypothetical protein